MRLLTFESIDSVCCGGRDIDADSGLISRSPFRILDQFLEAGTEFDWQPFQPAVLSRAFGNKKSADNKLAVRRFKYLPPSLVDKKTRLSD